MLAGLMLAGLAPGRLSQDADDRTQDLGPTRKLSHPHPLRSGKDARAPRWPFPLWLGRSGSVPCHPDRFTIARILQQSDPIARLNWLGPCRKADRSQLVRSNPILHSQVHNRAQIPERPSHGVARIPHRPLAGNETYATFWMEIDYVPIRPPVSGANWRRTNYMRTSRRAGTLRTGPGRG